MIEDGEKQEDGGGGGLRGQSSKRPKMRSLAGANPKRPRRAEGKGQSEVEESRSVMEMFVIKSIV